MRWKKSLNCSEEIPQKVNTTGIQWIILTEGTLYWVYNWLLTVWLLCLAKSGVDEIVIIHILRRVSHPNVYLGYSWPVLICNLFLASHFWINQYFQRWICIPHKYTERCGGNFPSNQVLYESLKIYYAKNLFSEEILWM